MALESIAHVLLGGPPLSSDAAHYAIKYQQLLNDMDILAQKEEMRQLRVNAEISRTKIDDIDEELWEQKELAREAEGEADLARVEIQSQLEETEEQLQVITTQLKSKERELCALKTEVSSLQNVSADSTKLLTEKLALARELDNLKPELEDLRSQVESRKGLLSDKLSLQRRVSSIQAELDNEKRNVEKLRAREERQAQGDAGLEAEVERFKEQLAKVQRDAERAEKAAVKESQEEVKKLKAELTKEKKERERADKSAAQTSSNSEQLDDLQKELARERREREKLEKQVSTIRSEMEAETAVLEDKLSQFRTKLKSTKEKLKEAEAELQEARSFAASKPSSASAPKAQNSRKRAAASIDPDASIGTPGDARPAKRTQRASSVIGEKSTFSITPFLNRTSSIAPEDRTKEHEHGEAGADADQPMASIETDSPIARRQAASVPAAGVAKPLAPAPSSKANAKILPATKERKKTASKTSLEKVVEEPDDDDDDDAAIEREEAPQAKQPLQKQSRQLKSTSLKPKSLSSFASFRAGSLPPQQIQSQQKKTRKLGGGAKTLFDEDEEDVATAETTGAIKGNQRAFGAFGSRAFGGLGAWAANRKKGPLVVAEDGFMFSPLKKDRKAIAIAL